jgi:hypothetical protein
MQQLGHQRPSGRLITDLLGGQPLGRQQCPQGLVVAAGLAVAAGHVDQVLGTPLHHWQLHRMDRLGMLEGRSPIAQGDRGRDPMNTDVGRAEGGEGVVGVGPQPTGRAGRLVQQRSAGDRVALVGGGHGALQQQRAIQRQMRR